MILHQLFSDIDDFCRDTLPEWKKTQLANGDKKRNRSKCLCESEMMTIMVSFQPSGYRTFKDFYLRYVKVYWQQAFPRLPSDNRFVELQAEVLNPLAAFMQSRCVKSQGIAFVDSTALRVCENIRIPRHKMQDVASHRQAGFMASNCTLPSTIAANRSHCALRAVTSMTETPCLILPTA